MSEPSRLAPRLTRGGVPVGSIAGIPILVAPSWALAAVLITLVYADVSRHNLGLSELGALALGLCFAVLLALSVLLHELGHCAISRMLGIPVRRVVIFLLGGVSEITGEPTRPRDEYLLSAAGPLVSLLLAGIGGLGLFYVDPRGVAGELLFQLTAANLVVAIFNLLPGLPLDGGRVLRAAVWRITGSPVTGTRVASWGGRILAVLIVGTTVWLYVGPRLVTVASIVIALVLATVMWVNAGSELAAVRAKERVGGVVVGELARPAAVVRADLPASEALRRAADGTDLAAGSGGILVVTDPADRVVGLLDLRRVRAAPARARPWTTVGELARAVQDDDLMLDSLSGPDLLAALRARPKPEYVVVGRDGTPVGVLLASDLAAVLTSARGART